MIQYGLQVVLFPCIYTIARLTHQLSNIKPLSSWCRVLYIRYNTCT